jgi:hypothetical protein
MATVRGVVNFNVKPGRYNDLLEALGSFGKIIQRLGADMIVNRVVVGNEANHLIAVVRYDDFAAYARAASDSELRTFIDAARNNENPPWESLAISLVEEVPLTK